MVKTQNEIKLWTLSSLCFLQTNKTHHYSRLLHPVLSPRSYLSYFRPTKFKTHYVAPQFFIFLRTVQIASNFLHWNACIFLFWLNPTGHSKFHNTSNHHPPATDSGRTARTPLYPPVQVVPPSSSPLLFFLSQTEEPAKAGTCARDRRALQQLALNVHVKHSDLTWPDLFSLTNKTIYCPSQTGSWGVCLGRHTWTLSECRTCGKRPLR